MDESQSAEATRQALGSAGCGKADQLADALREIWLAAAPPGGPDLTPGQKQFVRDWGIADTGFQAAGTPVPVLTAIGTEVGRAARRKVAEFLPLVRRLWDSHGREGRIVAVVALGPMELAEPATIVPLLRDLARTCVFWEDCDQLAMKALEPVLRKQPDTWLNRMGEWVLDENKWVRRAGLTAIGRLPMAKPAFTARCVEIVSSAVGDADTDVKRAVSFALRACARGDVAPVRAYLSTQAATRDVHRLWVLCDVIRSMTRTLLPEFTELLPLLRGWLASAEPAARRSVEGAIRALEGAGA